MGGRFAGRSAIRLIRFGHHLVGDVPDLLVFGAVVIVGFDCHHPCNDILLGCLCLVLVQASVCRILLPDNLPQSNTPPVFVLVLPVGLERLDSVL